MASQLLHYCCFLNFTGSMKEMLYEVGCLKSNEDMIVVVKKC